MPAVEHSDSQRRWILTALMLTMMLAAMDSTIVSTAIPQIVADLGGFTAFSWVFSIYLLAQTVTIPVYGKLADLYGRKPILVVGTLIFLVGSAASSGAWNIVSLIGFRALQGLGAGSIMATVNTLAGDLYDVRERARVQGWLSSVWGLAAIVGPAIGGTFAEYFSWRWIFLINLPIGIVALALILSFLKEQVTRRHPKIDFAGSALILVVIGLLILGLLEGGQAWPWLSVPAVVIFATVVVLGVALVFVERRAAEPVMPPWLWKRRALLGANLSMIGMGLVMMGPETYLPTFAQTSLGMGAIAAGFVLASMSIGWPLASALSGKLYLLIGFRNTGLIGAFTVVVGSAAFLTIPWPQPTWLLVIDQIVLGAGFGLLSTPMLVGIQSVVPWGERGVVTGTNMFFRNLGQSLGAAVFGAIFNNALEGRLRHSPTPLSGNHQDILALLKTSVLSAEQTGFVRAAINFATRHIYIGLVIFAVATLFAVMITPRRFLKSEEAV